LEAVWLQDRLGVTLAPKELAQLRRFDDPGGMERLDEIGQRAAEQQVRLADLAGSSLLGDESGALPPNDKEIAK
jgi:hypothetical protein